MMKAVLTQGSGGAEVLALCDVPVPQPGPGQVLVQVLATSVNRPDIVQREGKYPPPPGESEILGLEVAGVIAQLGPGVQGWHEGERVMSLVGGGAYAEFALARADHLIRVPDTMSMAAAACVCESYITAYLNVFILGGLRDGDAVLLHGGGGGVNTAAIQLCKALAPAARLVVTASPAKLERVRGLGADCVIDYTAVDDFAEAVKAYTDKKGVDVILDHIGARYLASNMNSLAYGGRLVVIGVMSGIKAELNLGLMMVKRQQIIGSVLRSRPAAEKAGIVAEFTRRVLPEFANGAIAPIIEEVFPLRDVGRAHAMMESGRHFGKIVLAVDSGV